MMKAEKVGKVAKVASLALTLVSMAQAAHAVDASQLDQPEQVKACFARVQKELAMSMKGHREFFDVRVGLGISPDFKSEVYVTFSSFEYTTAKVLGPKIETLEVLSLDIQTCTITSDTTMPLWSERALKTYFSHYPNHSCPAGIDSSELIAMPNEWIEKSFLTASVGKLNGQSISAQKWYDSETGQPVLRVARHEGCSSFGAGGPSQMFPINQDLTVDCKLGGNYCELKSKGEVSIGEAGQNAFAIATNSSKQLNRGLPSGLEREGVSSLVSGSASAQ